MLQMMNPDEMYSRSLGRRRQGVKVARHRVQVDVEQLRQLYGREGRSMLEIARIFGTNRETIRKRLRSEGIPVRRKGRPRRLFP